MQASSFSPCYAPVNPPKPLRGEVEERKREKDSDLKSHRKGGFSGAKRGKKRCKYSTNNCEKASNINGYVV